MNLCMLQALGKSLEGHDYDGVRLLICHTCHVLCYIFLPIGIHSLIFDWHLVCLHSAAFLLPELSLSLPVLELRVQVDACLARGSVIFMTTHISKLFVAFYDLKAHMPQAQSTSARCFRADVKQKFRFAEFPILQSQGPR